METETVTAEVAEGAAPDAVDDSLAAHEAQFGKGQPAAPAATEEAAEPPRHRAKSQRAGASDYEDIAKYTKLLRETEEGIDGFTLERQAGESDRVFNLRKRVEIAKLAKERRIAAAEPRQAAPAPAPVVQPAPVMASPVATAFTTPEPTLDQFGNEPDPYAAWLRATQKWDREKDAFEQARQATQAQTDQAKKDAEAQFQARITAWQGRVRAFAATKADFDQTTSDLYARNLPGLLLDALITHDKGPELVYYLGQHPDTVDDLHVVAAALPASADSVALLQRRLSKLSLPVGVTGATAGVSKPISASRPPTPVRTVPIASGDDLPGDESSLAEHEKAFGPKRRRR